jgi:putative membrane protein insertion efficiency factor
VYQWTLRPLIGANCRFEPSCSHYALAVLRSHGAAAGSLLAARRVLRCNPWNAGGFDPPPVPRNTLRDVLRDPGRPADGRDTTSGALAP